MTAPDFPNPILFDRKAARRAMRRGVVRTVSWVVLLLLLASVTGPVLGSALRAASGHGGELARVGRVGLQVANPDLFIGGSGSASYSPTHSWFRSSGEYTRISNQATGRDFDFTLRAQADGQLEELDLSTPLDRVLYRGSPGKASGSAFVKALPESTLTAAVVAFATPMSVDELDRHFSDKLRDTVESSAAYLYDDPLRTPERLAKERPGQLASCPVTWPTYGGLAGYNSFGSWASALKRSDDGSLNALGLPSSATIKRLAMGGRVYAIYSPSLTVQDMTALLADPAVSALVPTVVRFDFDATRVDG